MKRILYKIPSLRYGSGYLLILFNFILLIVIVLDILKVHQNGLVYLTNGVNIDVALNSFTMWSLLKFLIFFFVPLFITSCLNFVLFHLNVKGFYNKVYQLTSRRKNLILILHLLFSFFAAYHCGIIKQYSVLSGYCGTSLCFQSIFDTLTRSWIFWTIFLIPIIGALFSVLFQIIFNSSDLQSLKNNFNSWLNISDIVGSYHPIHGDEMIYADNAAMAPTINKIEKDASRMFSEYEFKVPTSGQARDFLLQKAVETREYLKSHLIPPHLPSEIYQIDFFTGTSRALEVVVAKLENVEFIVSSPYEHHSQRTVIDWFHKINGLRHIPLREVDLEIYSNDWAFQYSLFKHQIAELFTDIDDNVKFALLISEVNYKTGMILNISQIMNDLRSDYPNIIFIIDGSQAVGNIANPCSNFIESIGNNDIYYFSAHKWLLSPNTCGVVLSHRDTTPDLQEVIPYDMFGYRLPVSTIDPNTIFGIRSSLEFLFETNLSNKLREEALHLKEIFCEELNKKAKLNVIQSNERDIFKSVFCAVKPNDGFEWRMSLNEFWGQLRRKGINISVNKMNEELDEVCHEYWLRISFSYFNSPRIMKNLVKHLNNFVVPINE